MMTKLRMTLLAALAATLLSPAAHAHRTWLLPSAGQVEGKEPWVTIDAAVSENLFHPDTNPLKLDGLSVIGPDGAAVTPDNPFTGRLRSSFDLKLGKPGTYKVSLVAESVLASYKLNGETKRWRGSEAAMAAALPANAEEVTVTRMHNRLETFVTAGKGNDTALQPGGNGLALVPLTHPADLTSGQKASFRFLLDGKPVAGLAVSVIPGGVRHRGALQEISLRTDERGEFALTWPAGGMYWLNASFPPRPPQAAGTPTGGAQPARRLSYAATLEVLPE